MMNMITETSVTMPSVTHAMKAKKIFFQLGYNCVIKRLSGSFQKGCTHYISVNTDMENVISILRKHGIKYGEILSKVVGT